MSQSAQNPNVAPSERVVASLSALRAAVENGQKRNNIPQFRVGDTVKVHAKIREGNKERVQVFEGLVIRRHSGNLSTATFTVRKISYNIGVERIFFVHSPMIEKIEVVSAGRVRRARLFYLRELRGKSARIKSKLLVASDAASSPAAAASEQPAKEG
jgi:large subunit ribosomal protein L19